MNSGLRTPQGTAVEIDDVDYKDVKPLVEDVSSRGKTTTVTFECPRSLETKEVQVDVDTSEKKKKSAGADLKKGMFRSLIRIIRRFVVRLLPGRAVGREARKQLSARNVEKAGEALKGHSKKERKAIVEAFQQTGGEFVWDESEEQWVHREAEEAA